MDYISENHSKHLLMCHLIFVCKYRKKLLIHLGEYIKQETLNISNHYGWQIIEQEVDKDHIHSINSIFSKMEYFTNRKITKTTNNISSVAKI